MIAIKDMPMPKNCYECWFEDANQCYLNILQHIESLDRPDWCPLVEADPTKHGHWIGISSGQECSVCGEIQYGYDSYRNYCANCGARMDEAPDCETCKDAPIPPIYSCLGYEPAESTMGQLNPDELINHHIENDGTYAAGEEEPDGQ